MSCLILVDPKRGACFMRMRKTNFIVFGPVFSDQAEARAFEQYLTQHPCGSQARKGWEYSDDPRAYRLKDLMDLWEKFKAQEEKAAIEETLHRR